LSGARIAVGLAKKDFASIPMVEQEIFGLEIGSALTENARKVGEVGMKQEDLKPCPFCGKSKALVVWNDPARIDDIVIDQWRVSCGESFENRGCGASTGCFIKREYAIKAWNRRANE